MRLPIRARLALVTAALSALVIGVGAFLLFTQLERGLIEGVDAGLRARSFALMDSPFHVSPRARLSLGDETFEQVVRIDGADVEVLESSPAVAGRPLVSADAIRGLDAARFRRGIVATGEELVEARMLAQPLGHREYLIVGTSLDDQNEALGRLRALLLVGGPLAVLLIAGVGWLVAGVAFRPVERMREEAAAISASELDRRLPVPDTGDELARLGRTLNDMLARLEESLRRERRFVDDASHELRTPLANLRTELELALRRSRSAQDLEAALRSAAQEAESLSRLAEDLLVLARANEGRLPVRLEATRLDDLVEGVVDGFRLQAEAADVHIASNASDGVVNVDPLRIRQAVGNLVDNALRYSPSGGRIDVRAEATNGTLSISVEDAGPGFAPEFLPRAFEPLARPDAGRGRPHGGTGLGLSIVRAVAEAHGGVAEATNRPNGGASVTLRIPVSLTLLSSKVAHARRVKEVGE